MNIFRRLLAATLTVLTVLAIVEIGNPTTCGVWSGEDALGLVVTLVSVAALGFFAGEENQ